jgi:O-succinylbenzoate synthase
MKLERITLHRLAMPLVRPFETSFGRQLERDVLLVHVVGADGAEGWGECVAGADPVYSSEYVSGAEQVIQNYLGPALLAAPEVTAETVDARLRFVVGHRMAKAAVEAAVLDAQLRASGTSFARYLGAVRDEVDCGVSVGIAATIDELLDEVAGYVAEGYRRIKLKIKPGWDLEPVRAVRALLGDGALLQVDANTAYTSTTCVSSTSSGLCSSSSHSSKTTSRRTWRSRRRSIRPSASTSRSPRRLWRSTRSRGTPPRSST